MALPPRRRHIQLPRLGAPKSNSDFACGATWLKVEHSSAAYFNPRKALDIFATPSIKEHRLLRPPRGDTSSSLPLELESPTQISLAVSRRSVPPSLLAGRARDMCLAALLAFDGSLLVRMANHSLFKAAPTLPVSQIAMAPPSLERLPRARPGLRWAAGRLPLFLAVSCLVSCCLCAYTVLLSLWSQAPMDDGGRFHVLGRWDEFRFLQFGFCMCGSRIFALVSPFRCRL